MNNIKDNKFFIMLIALFAFFILIFFTKNYYTNLQENILKNDANNIKIKELDLKLDELNSLKNDLNDSSKQKTKNLKKFMWEFNEADLVLYINDYIEKTNKSAWDIVLFLDNISFSEPIKSEFWFKKVDINLKLKVANRYILKNILDYFVNQDNKYSFFITDFSFPIEELWPYKIDIPLKMYVK